MRRNHDLDWNAIALAGDAGAVPDRPALAPSPRRWRPSRLGILLLVGWLAWESAGVVRAATIGPPILEAIWDHRP